MRKLVLFIITLLTSASTVHARDLACLGFYDLSARAVVSERHPNEFRKILVQNFLFKQVTTESDRVEFVKMNGLEPRPNRIAIEFENSMLKFVNDVLQDKDAATALDNMANSYVLNKVTQWTNQNYPGSRIHKYSDGKSLTLIIDTPKALRLRDRLDIEAEFDIFQKDLGLLLRSKKLFRDSDKVEDWFRMGTGSSADEAYFAARFSRKLAGPNKVIHYSHPKVRKQLADTLYYAEYYRAQISGVATLKTLLTRESVTGKKMPNKLLFEALRKSHSALELSTYLKERFQLNLESKALDWLIIYGELVDLLNPKFFVVDQTVVTLAKAINGGIVVDRKGMGAANQLATAIAALQSAHSVSGKLSITDLAPEQLLALSPAIVSRFEKNNRRQEALVTAEVNTYRKHMETKWGAKCRGDDCAIDDISKIIIADFLNDEKIRGERVVKIPALIALEHSRSELSTHGEGLEKKLASQLYKYLNGTTLAQITFAIDFKTTELGTGPVDLIINPLNSIILDQALILQIQSAFSLAIQEFNTEQARQNKPTQYFFIGNFTAPSTF